VSIIFSYLRFKFIFSLIWLSVCTPWEPIELPTSCVVTVVVVRWLRTASCRASSTRPHCYCPLDMPLIWRLVRRMLAPWPCTSWTPPCPLVCPCLEPLLHFLQLWVSLWQQQLEVHNVRVHRDVLCACYKEPSRISGTGSAIWSKTSFCAYWPPSPSKWSPSAGTHRSQRFCHF
jgi:hypothetical protein